MSSLYSANQYDNAFVAKRLQNYQIPDQHKQRPSTRAGATQVVANERGHLLPGVARSPASPWGDFKGTWEEDRNCRQTKHAKTLITSKSKNASAVKQQVEAVPAIAAVEDKPPTPVAEAKAPTPVAGSPKPPTPVAASPKPPTPVAASPVAASPAAASPKPATPVASPVPASPVASPIAE